MNVSASGLLTQIQLERNQKSEAQKSETENNPKNDPKKKKYRPNEWTQRMNSYQDRVSFPAVEIESNPL